MPEVLTKHLCSDTAQGRASHWSTASLLLLRREDTRQRINTTSKGFPDPAPAASWLGGGAKQPEVTGAHLFTSVHLSRWELKLTCSPPDLLHEALPADVDLHRKQKAP